VRSVLCQGGLNRTAACLTPELLKSARLSITVQTQQFIFVHVSTEIRKLRGNRFLAITYVASTLHPLTVRLFTEGDDTRGCGDTIGPPDDEQRAARNMLRSVV